MFQSVSIIAGHIEYISSSAIHLGRNTCGILDDIVSIAVIG